MSKIVYKYGSELYINLTNDCPCACTFCIRDRGQGVGDADSLWLSKDPTANDVIKELKANDSADFSEVVFCGYGEPMCAFPVLLEVAKWLKEQGKKVRLNTNGLGDLINKKPTAPELNGLIDVISISLNASNKESYQELVNSKYGPKSFDAMINFVKDCKNYIPKVIMTVVDIISKDEIESCRKIADNLGVEFRVRNFS